MSETITLLTMAGKESIFKIVDAREHITAKAMWAGSLKRELIKGIIGMDNNAIVNIITEQVEALLKAFNEIIVNASDHYLGSIEEIINEYRVTSIKISFDAETGIFSVFNNGKGVPTSVHKGASVGGNIIYEPEVAFSNCMAGSNIVKEKDNVKGGINGLGAKIANIHSTWFNIKTLSYDNRNIKQLYEQKWEKRMTVSNRPKIVPADDYDAEFTEITLLPAYKELDYLVNKSGLPDKNTLLDIQRWLRLHAHLTAAFVGSAVEVEFNGEVCETNCANKLAELMATKYVVDPDIMKNVVISSFQLHSAIYRNYVWQVAVVIYPTDVKTPNLSDLSIVNGVISYKGGSHLTYIRTILKKDIEEIIQEHKKTGDKLKMDDIFKGVQLIFLGAIPGVDWGSQSKTDIVIPPATLKAWTINRATISDIVAHISLRVIVRPEVQTKKIVLNEKKFKPATAPASKKHLTSIMLAEGNSAISLLVAGLSALPVAAPGDPSFEWFGYLTLQGVIPNAAKGFTEIESVLGKMQVMKDALKKNERLNTLASTIGLTFGKQTAATIAAMNYGKIIICVDQDLDGAGKIAGLVLVWLHTCFPGIIEAGLVYKFITPLIRIYERDGDPPLAEFYSDLEYKEWLDKNPNSPAPKYYKGLAAHSQEETARMFEPANFKRHLFKYVIDGDAATAFDIYFGKKAALRKIALATPPQTLSIARRLELNTNQTIPIVEEQLNIDTNSYKRDAISRQIPSLIDGLNPARRKAVCGAEMRFVGNADVKVFQVSGFSADKMFYHHGDQSFNATFIYMAQAYTNARKFPLMLGVGIFGNRHGGEAGEARYVGVKRSPFYSAIFPSQDKYFLEYVYEDGCKAEPRNLVPVVPLSILESNNNVSEGWKNVTFGRDLNKTIEAVKGFISGDSLLRAASVAITDEINAGEYRLSAAAKVKLATAHAKWPLPIDTYGFKGPIKMVGKNKYSVGTYVMQPDGNVLITDLPIGYKTITYKEVLATLDEVTDVIDTSGEDTINILVKLAPNAIRNFEESRAANIAEVGELDAIEHGLRLRLSVMPNLNFYTDLKTVIEFDNDDSGYLGALLYWAPKRVNLYVQRISRVKEIATLRKIEYENIIRYINLFNLGRPDENASTANQARPRKFTNEDEMSEYLAAENFQPLNTAILNAPDMCTNITETALNSTSFTYLFNLRSSELTDAAAAKYAEKIKEQQIKIDEADAILNEKPTPCASVWLREINDFMTVVKDYREKNIKTGRKKPTQAKASKARK